MPEAAGDWAGARRRRWSASRVAAALALHALVLVALKLAVDRVEMPARGADRATTLVTVVLHAAPPPPHDLPLPLPKPSRMPTRSPARTPAPASRAPDVPAPTPGPSRDPELELEREPRAITLPAPPVAAAAPPASAPLDLKFLDDAATRQAIRGVARGDTLASHAAALTHEDDGSELLAADGSHDGGVRHLPPPPPARLLARNIAAAHKGDCSKGEYAGGGMGLLSVPFLVAAEAMGHCSSK